MIESKELIGDSYVYDVRNKDWQQLATLKVIKQFFPNLKTGIQVKHRPTFHPPFKIPNGVKLKSGVIDANEAKEILEKSRQQVIERKETKEDLSQALNNVSKNLSSKIDSLSKDILIEELENQVKHLKSQSNEDKDQEINLLKDQVKSLNFEIDSMKDAYESANDSLEVHETKEEVLKSVILELKKDLISNSEEKDSVKTREEFKNISNKNSVLKKKIRTTNKELKSIKAEFEATSSQLEKFQNENKELHSIRLKAIKIIENKKIEIEKLKKHHSFLTKSHKELKNNVVELKANENKLSSQVSGYQEKIEAKEAEELELNLQNEEEELQRLVGDSYEVQNEAIWYYGDKSNEQGPFTFEQMLEYKSNKTINDKTKIRQEGKAFAHPMAEVFELCINVTVFKTNAGHNRYFIKRDSYRAPFYEIITLEIDGKEFKGYCTSLSTGGAFVEFTKLDKDLMISDATARISFKHGTLSEGFSNIVSIKNISNQKPRGLGLMFEDLDAKKKKIILEYVNGFLDKSKSVDDLVNNYLKDNKKVS